ncbi:MAG TPA: hypothetical protein VIM29_07515 [Bacillota bacterium]
MAGLTIRDFTKKVTALADGRRLIYYNFNPPELINKPKPVFQGRRKER